MRASALVAATLLSILSAATVASAADYTLSPGVAQSAVAKQIDALEPGDTLTLLPGEYDGIDLDLMHADMSGVAGTASKPITIRGKADAGGNLPHVVANTTHYQEAVRLRPGCAYLAIQSLHLSAKGTQTQAGIFIDSGVHDVQITDAVIEDVTGIGIQAHSQSDVHDLLIEHNDIHDTGTNTSDGNNGGQGFQAGGFDPTTATKNVYHLVVRRNLIHDITGQEGDCIGLLYGVYASTVEDNVLYDCPRGVSSETENYGIAVYGSGVGHYEDAADDNLVLRNLVLGTAAVLSGHDNVAIYAGPGVQVVNNLILQSNQGIAARLESEASVMRNLTVVNNTVYGATDNAFSIRGCQKADASVIVTGNALFAVGTAGFGYRMPDPLGNMIAKANYYEGQDYAEAAPPVMNHLAASDGAIFVTASMSVPGADFMLAAGSPLIDVADKGTAPANDFDLATRPVGAGPDVGAYERRPNLSNHWALALTFKGEFASGGTGSDGGVPMKDGGSGDVGPGDDGGSGASPGKGSSGCGCRVPRGRQTGSDAILGFALLLLASARTRCRASATRRLIA